MINDLLDKVFRRKHYQPSKGLLKSLAANFKNCKNIEWCLSDPNQPEAIFFIGDQEYIARFSPSGEMAEYRVNLPLDALPSHIKDYVDTHGELMNAIEIKKTGQIATFELIVRDSNLTRYSLVVNSDKTLLKKEKL